jgi:aspartate/methionine/tyrosine aminotransferase
VRWLPFVFVRYAATYGVRLDASTQALSLIGSQEGLGHLLLAIADPGDGILMLDVAYPSYFGAGECCHTL